MISTMAKTILKKQRKVALRDTEELYSGTERQIYKLHTSRRHLALRVSVLYTRETVAGRWKRVGNNQNNQETKSPKQIIPGSVSLL